MFSRETSENITDANAFPGAPAQDPKKQRGIPVRNAWNVNRPPTQNEITHPFLCIRGREMTASAGKRCPREQCSLSFWFTPFIRTHPSKKEKKIPWEAPGMQMHAGKCVDLHPFIAANTLCAKCCRDMVKMLKLRRRALVTSPTHKLYTHKRQL